MCSYARAPTKPRLRPHGTHARYLWSYPAGGNPSITTRLAAAVPHHYPLRPRNATCPLIQSNQTADAVVDCGLWTLKSTVNFRQGTLDWKDNDYEQDASFNGDGEEYSVQLVAFDVC